MSSRTAADSPQAEATADGWRLALPSWARPRFHPTTILLVALPVMFVAALTTFVMAIRSGSGPAHAVPHIRLMVAWGLTMFSLMAMLAGNARLLRLLIKRLADRFGRRELVLAGRKLSLRRHWVMWRTLDRCELRGAATVELSAEGELSIVVEGQMPMRIAAGRMTEEARSLQRTLEKALKSSERRIANAKYEIRESVPAAPLTPLPRAYAIVAFGLLFTTVAVSFAVYQDVMLTDVRSVPAKMLSCSINPRSRSRVQVWFVYDVDGVEYHCDSLWPADLTSQLSAEDLAADVAAVTKSTKLLALYPAEFPSHAYLVRRRGTGTEVLILAGGFFLLLGMFKVARWPKTQLLAVAMWMVLGAIAIGDSAFGPMGAISTRLIVSTVIWLAVAAMAFIFARANQHRQTEGGGENLPGDASSATLAIPRRAVAKSFETTAPRGSRAVASELSQGGIRIVIRRNLPVAIACGILLALSLIALLSMSTGHIAWIRSLNPKVQSGDLIGFVATAVTAAVLLSFVLVRALTTRIFEADQAGLSRTSEGPMGRHSKRWIRDDIAGIDAVTRTYSGGRGGSRTVHTLEIRRKAGRTVKLVGNLKKAELEWMGDLLSAALRIPTP